MSPSSTYVVLQNDLCDQIDLTTSECLNCIKDSNQVKNCFLNDPAKIIQSDADEQIIISLNFKVPVRPLSIQLIGVDDGPLHLL